MISPTKIYDQAQVLTPDQAAGIIAEAIVNRPTRVATGLGLFWGRACRPRHRGSA